MCAFNLHVIYDNFNTLGTSKIKNKLNWKLKVKEYFTERDGSVRRRSLGKWILSTFLPILKRVTVKINDLLEYSNIKL